MTATEELDGLAGLGRVDGKRIVVVGCGEGRLVRLISAAGARAFDQPFRANLLRKS